MMKKSNAGLARWKNIKVFVRVETYDYYYFEERAKREVFPVGSERGDEKGARNPPY